MPLIHLSDTLFQMHDIIQLAAKISPLSLSAEVAFFIAEGHIMEVIDLYLPDKKIVALFFGPNEFIVKCHPLSRFVALDDIEGSPFTHGQIIRLLREFPETHLHYQVIRRTYQEKVVARQASLTTMSEKARFEDMIKTQPWILELADKKDIAAYLNISTSLLYELINNAV
jgi:hypothetical protein